MKRIFSYFKRPGKLALAIVYPMTAIAIGAAIFLMIRSYSGVLAALTYTVYGISAVLFGYSVYTIVIFIPKMKAKIMEMLKSNPITSELLDSFGYRTMIGLCLSLGVSVAYGIFNGVIGIVNGSTWFGSLSAYYLLLTLIRSAVLINHRKSKGEGDRLRREKTYLISGMGMLLLNIALSVAIAQMIFDEKGFAYGEYMIYVSALYSFIKIGMSIYNFVKGQRQSDLIIESARNINLVDGAVSILALQTAMLYSFSSEEMNISLINTLTGSAVSILAYTVAFYMIVKGVKVINKVKSENNNG